MVEKQPLVFLTLILLGRLVAYLKEKAKMPTYFLKPVILKVGLLDPGPVAAASENLLETSWLLFILDYPRPLHPGNQVWGGPRATCLNKHVKV